MSGTTRRVKDFKEVFTELGCHLDSTEVTGACHFKFFVTYNGNKRFFIGPMSTSDKRRGILNFRGEVVRWIRSLQEANG